MIRRIINGIRLFRNKKKESYFAFYNILGFFPEKIHLYEEALRHKSSSKEGENGRHLNNERLEFLGDAVLDTIVADLVFHKFQNRNEGFLTNTRSKVVKRETLDHIAKELGLDKRIVSSSRISTQKSHIPGNALEALIGAIYLDKGYETTRKFVEKRMIEPYINIDALAKKEVNFKSKLLEWTQKHKVRLEFRLVESFLDGDNNPIFQSQALLNDILVGIGTGFSKKESQQQAAHMALKKIKSDKEFVEKIRGDLENKENGEPEEPEEIKSTAEEPTAEEPSE